MRRIQLELPVLLGTNVRIEPLGVEHAEDLLEAGRDVDMWRFLPRPPLRDLDDCRRWIAEARAKHDAGLEMPFAICLVSGRAVGSTRYLAIEPEHRSIEIGWTWLAPDYRRTFVNTEAKYLLLRYAFEVMGIQRVAIKTDLLNVASQRAIERIGAVREGLFRKHRQVWDGRIRDTVWYSIVDDDWSDIKARFRGPLRRAGFRGIS